MKEYEYSIRTNDIKPFIDYCKKNSYVLKSAIKQNRIVYENRNNRKILARITTIESNREKATIFDCKNVESGDSRFKLSRESKEMIIDENNRTINESMLDVMDFEKSADNLRIRYEYVNGDVKFEIDDYIRPEMKVVAIEGKPDLVDKIYQEIINNVNIKSSIENLYKEQ